MIFQSAFFPVDALSRFMLLVIGLLSPLIVAYSVPYIKRNALRYYLMLAAALIGMTGTVLARDFLSFFVFLEIMAVSVYFLIIDNAKKESFPAGYRYILMMTAGGALRLAAIVMLFNMTGTFDMETITASLHFIPIPSAALVFTLFASGCLFEAGAVPFHIWLPTAHPVAPSPVSALLSGLAIKMGAYGVVRMLFTLRAGYSGLIVLGLVSIFFGILMAFRQNNIKVMLAYSSISQMGYILLGLGLGTAAGMAGSLYHIFNHASFKTLLFLCAGAVIYSAGERRLDRLGGLIKRMPLTAMAFLAASLAISGIPPFNGFISKTILSGSSSSFPFMKPALILASSLTIALFIRAFKMVFLGDLPDGLRESVEPPKMMLVPLMVLALICLAAGLFPFILLRGFIDPFIGFSAVSGLWSLASLADAAAALLLGVLIFAWADRMGFGRELRPSLDKSVTFAAAAFERGCAKLNSLNARSLNAYILWIFVALTGILLLTMLLN